MTEHDPIQVLMDEHDIISSVKKVTRHIDNLWKEDAGKYENSVQKLIEFFKDYSDKYHHYKEEEVLFQEMANHPEFRVPEILDELEEHHNMFRTNVNDIAEALDEQKWELTQATLERYTNDLLDHISVENDEVFIMAETLFSDTELERIYFLFQDIDIKLGQERKQQLAAILNHIQNT